MAKSAETAPQRDERGRLLPGNQLGRMRSKEYVSRKFLGVGQDEDDEVYQDTRKLYFELCDDLPSDSHNVRTKLARQARNSVLSVVYMQKAKTVGLCTDDGMVFVEMSHTCDHRAECASKAALAVVTIEQKLDKKNEDPGEGLEVFNTKEKS